MKWTRADTLTFTMLLALLVFAFFIKVSYPPVRIWDEARNANNALNMYQHGRWLVPYYEGAPDMWNTKPPLLIWWQALNMHVFGVNEWSVRMPAALCALATGVFLWWFGRRILRSPWPGFLAGSVLATTFAYVYNHAGRTGDFDAPMVLFQLLSACCLFLFTQQPLRKYLWGIWLFLLLAALTKGIAGLTLAPGMLLFLLVQKKLVVALRMRETWLGALLFLAVLVAYYGVREWVNPGYLRAVYDNELGGRYLDALEGHQGPFGYYFDNLRNWRYPFWHWFVLPVFVAGLITRNALVRKLTLFNLLMTVPFFLIISSAGTKLEWYELPIYPFLALQIGMVLWWSGSRLLNRIPLRLQVASAVLAFLLIFHYPFKTVALEVLSFQERPWTEVPHRMGYFLKNAIHNKEPLNQYLFCYDGYNGQIDYYVRQLQAGGSTIRLQSDLQLPEAGWRMVVAQDELEQQLDRLPRLTRLEKKYGCTVYLVR